MSLASDKAYAAMYIFLEDYYSRTHADEIGALLGSMSLLEDGTTADPAIESDWYDAVQKVERGEFDLRLQLSRE